MANKKEFKAVPMSLDEIIAFSKLKEGERLELPAVPGYRHTAYIEKQGELGKWYRGGTPTLYTGVKLSEPSKIGITSANQDETEKALEEGFGETSTRGGGVKIRFHLVNRDGSAYVPNSIKFDDGDINLKVMAVIDGQETDETVMELIGLASPQLDPHIK